MILSLVSEKGGVGKSTLALSIATQWMSKGRRVLLVDADPQGTCRLACLEAREAGLLAPDCIAGGTHMSRDVRKFSEAYENIIIDTPGRLGELQRAALLCSEVALIPVAPTAPDVWALQSVMDSIRLVQKQRPLKAALVMAKLMRRTVMAEQAREILKPVGLPIFKASTHIRAAWAETLGRGQGVAQYEPGGIAAEELRQLVAELGRFAGGAP